LRRQRLLLLLHLWKPHLLLLQTQHQLTLLQWLPTQLLPQPLLALSKPLPVPLLMLLPLALPTLPKPLLTLLLKPPKLL